MPAAEAIVTALERNWEMIDAAVAGLDRDDLARLPADQCNSMAWILWHMSRVVDTFIHVRLQSKPQLWIVDRWHRKFGMGDDPEARGFGWSYDRVKAWAPPSRDVMVGYYGAVVAAARQYLGSLTDADLNRRGVIPPVQEPRTVANALGHMVWESVAHGGQIAYLRGLVRGMGWHR